MQTSPAFKTALLSCLLVLMAGTAQAQSPSGPAAQTGNSGSDTTTVTTPVAPPEQAVPPATTTRVEIHNQAPAPAATAPAQNIKIEMPAAPEARLDAPETRQDTVIERSDTTIIRENAPAAPAADKTLLYGLVFGLAVLLAIVAAVFYSRRRTVLINTRRP